MIYKSAKAYLPGSTLISHAYATFSLQSITHVGAKFCTQSFAHIHTHMHAHTHTFRKIIKPDTLPICRHVPGLTIAQKNHLFFDW